MEKVILNFNVEVIAARLAAIGKKGGNLYWATSQEQPISSI